MPGHVQLQLWNHNRTLCSGLSQLKNSIAAKQCWGSACSTGPTERTPLKHHTDLPHRGFVCGGAARRSTARAWAPAAAPSRRPSLPPPCCRRGGPASPARQVGRSGAGAIMSWRFRDTSADLHTGTDTSTTSNQWHELAIDRSTQHSTRFALCAPCVEMCRTCCCSCRSPPRAPPSCCRSPHTPPAGELNSTNSGGRLPASVNTPLDAAATLCAPLQRSPQGRPQRCCGPAAPRSPACAAC